MIQDLIQKEEERQKRVTNLIASENYPSDAVRAALSSSLVGKYAEGRPHARYYAGNAVVDQIEVATQDLCLRAFDLNAESWSVNVQPYSGSIANLAAYIGALQLGDTILAMSLAHGGHLTHGHSVSFVSKIFHFAHYGVNEMDLLDYNEIARIAQEVKPKLIVCGATAYPRIIDFARFRKIADSCGALLMADVSHIAGLIVGGVHPSPFPHADIVTSTTHKTLRGPRGACIITRRGVLVESLSGKKRSLDDAINRAVFPGLQGGPHLHTIAAMGIAFQEAVSIEFKQYAQAVIENASAFAEALLAEGFELITGSSENHLILVDVLKRGYGGQEAQNLLEQNNIIVNKNALPHDFRSPNDPSGIRLGVQAETSRGLTPRDFRALAARIAAILPQK